MAEAKRRALILRLSSLGDIVLSSAILETGFASEYCVEWLVSKEYSELLNGHPKIHAVREFDRRAGLAAWVSLCRQLYAERFDLVIDLHGSLRSRLARLLFAWWRVREGGKGRFRWRSASRQRIRFYGYILLKRFWPRSWRPDQKRAISARMGGGDGTECGNLRHLTGVVEAAAVGMPVPEGAVAVMPSSAWAGKCWPVGKFADAIIETGIFPVILGSAKDEASLRLEEILRQRRVPFCSAVGKLGLAGVASVLSRCAAYLGNDTGLAHLAEAMGVPAVMIFGPTTPELGFGPALDGSRAVGRTLGCRPCGKDGRYCCYSGDLRFQCLRRFGIEEPVRALREVLSRGKEALP